MNSFDYTLASDDLKVFDTRDVMFQWNAIGMIVQWFETVCVTLRKTNERTILERTKGEKGNRNLANGIEPLCWLNN